MGKGIYLFCACYSIPAPRPPFRKCLKNVLKMFNLLTLLIEKISEKRKNGLCRCFKNQKKTLYIVLGTLLIISEHIVDSVSNDAG